MLLQPYITFLPSYLTSQSVTFPFLPELCALTCPVLPGPVSGPGRVASGTRVRARSAAGGSRAFGAGAAGQGQGSACGTGWTDAGRFAVVI